VPLPDALLDLLSRPSPCFVATVMPDGSPQMTQTWVDTDGTHLLINTVDGHQKVRLDGQELDVRAQIRNVKGFSGHGVAAAGLAGEVIAEAIVGQSERLDVFQRLRHAPFPGGRLLRMPLLVAAMSWYKLRDALW